MTRDEQDTERALARAEQEWLQARGWTLVAGSANTLGSGLGAQRFSHPAAPSAREHYTRRDSISMTRADPLRFMTRRHTAGPA